jgi:tRNA (guanine-N7-)-methyltransferase
MPRDPTKGLKREAYKNANTSGEQSAALPQKKFFRQRAHANPFSDHSLA